MGSKKEPVNPFYVLLVLAAVALVVTSLATLVDLGTLDPLAASIDEAPSPIAGFLHEWSSTLIFAETGVLAVSGVLAMVWDRVRSRDPKPADELRDNREPN